MPQILSNWQIATLLIEMINSSTVGVLAEPLHGRMHAGEEARKARDPEITQLLLWTQGCPHLRGELVIVVVGVPHKSVGVGD